MRHYLIVEELLSSGHLWRASNVSLREEAAVMLQAVAGDLVSVAGVRVSVLLSAEALAGSVGCRLRAAGVELLLAADGAEEWLRSPSVNPAQFTATLAIAPETAGLLVQRLQQLQSAAWSGVTSLNVPWRQAALFGDKAATAVWLQARGLATPATLALTAAAAERLAAFRASGRLDLRTGLLNSDAWGTVQSGETSLYVLKPRDGCGCGDVQLVCLARDEAAAPSAGVVQVVDEVPGAEYLWLLQPLQPGLHCSAGLIGRGEGLAVLLPAGEQVVECQSGRFRYLGGSLPAAGSVQEAAGEMLRKLAAAMPDFRGWLGVDFVCGVDGEPRIVEINPRLCTSYVGYRQLARFSLAGVMSGEIAVDDLGLAWRAERVDFRV